MEITIYDDGQYSAKRQHPRRQQTRDRQRPAATTRPQRFYRLVVLP